MPDPAAVLRLLADLAPRAAAARRRTWDVRDNGPGWVAGHFDAARGRLAWQKAALVHREEDLGRVGTMVLVGSLERDGAVRTVVAPLLSRRVAPFELAPLQADDARSAALPFDVSPWAVELGVADALPEGLAAVAPQQAEITPSLLRAMPRLSAAVDALRAAGLPVTGVDGDPRAVARRAGGGELWLVACTIGYLDREPDDGDRRGALASWRDTDVRGTAFAALHAGGDDEEVPPPLAPDEPRSPLPLSRDQRLAVLDARHHRVGVLSGGPGTGKSHTAVAVALDAVAHGRSVLLATRSVHAADVLAELLDRASGPTPVRFGDGPLARDLATRLADGLPPGADTDQLRDAAREVGTAAGRVVAAHAAVGAALAAVGGAHDAGLVLRTLVPGPYAPGADHGALARLLATADDTGSWWRRRRAGRAARQVRELAGVGPDTSLDEVARALADARGRRLVAALEAGGERDLEQLWTAHDDATAALRTAVAGRVELLVQGARGRRQRRAVAALATALRAGRRRRRDLLAAVPHDHLLGALPLWVGTLGEVEHLLPAVPAMFDLVVVDEASQVDQRLAAPALLRARSALVVGDPRQLRHVSFVADDALDAALERHGLAAHAALLDVRRVTAFDAAAAVAPVRWLDDHVRSVPHLVRFSAERFYPDRLRVATQHPTVDGRDAIDVVRVDGTAVDGVVAAEVDAVLDVVRRLADGGATSVGVATPFRAHADALEAALLDALDLATLARLDLRIGTVHAWQGGERDHVVLSVGVTPDAPRRARFAGRTDLWNVAVTRARRHCTVVTSLPEDAEGLVADYLAHAERPPVRGDGASLDHGWTRALAAELARLDRDVSTGYRVGAEVVDVVLGTGPDAVALATRPHPRGVAAHVERRRALRHVGWRTLDVLPALWDDDPVTAALELQHLVGPPARPAG